MRLASTSVLLAAVAACAPPATSTGVVIPSPPAVASAPTPATGAKTCRIEQDEFLPPSAITLRTPRGAAFAELERADHVELTARGGVRLEVTVFGLRLSTAPSPADLPVYAREELVFASVLKPGGSTPLRWAPEADRWSVSPRDDERVEWIGAAPARLVGCDGISLQPTALSNDGEGESATLSAAVPIPLRATPDGPPVARLHATDAGVVVLARQRGLARIDWALEGDGLDDAHVVGWVDASFVHAEIAPRSASTSCRGGGMSASSDWTGCRRPHPIYVQVAHRVEPVGAILAGTRVTPGARLGNFERVEVVGPAVRDSASPVSLREGVSFVMALADAEDCR